MQPGHRLLALSPSLRQWIAQYTSIPSESILQQVSFREESNSLHIIGMPEEALMPLCCGIYLLSPCPFYMGDLEDPLMAQWLLPIHRWMQKCDQWGYEVRTEDPHLTPSSSMGDLSRWRKGFFEGTTLPSLDSFVGDGSLVFSSDPHPYCLISQWLKQRGFSPLAQIRAPRSYYASLTALCIQHKLPYTILDEPTYHPLFAGVCTLLQLLMGRWTKGECLALAHHPCFILPSDEEEKLEQFWHSFHWGVNASHRHLISRNHQDNRREDQKENQEEDLGGSQEREHSPFTLQATLETEHSDSPSNKQTQEPYSREKQVTRLFLSLWEETHCIRSQERFTPSQWAQRAEAWIRLIFRTDPEHISSESVAPTGVLENTSKESEEEGISQTPPKKDMRRDLQNLLAQLHEGCTTLRTTCPTLSFEELYPLLQEQLRGPIPPIDFETRTSQQAQLLICPHETLLPAEHILLVGIESPLPLLQALCGTQDNTQGSLWVSSADPALTAILSEVMPLSPSLSSPLKHPTKPTSKPRIQEKEKSPKEDQGGCSICNVSSSPPWRMTFLSPTAQTKQLSIGSCQEALLCPLKRYAFLRFTQREEEEEWYLSPLKKERAAREQAQRKTPRTASPTSHLFETASQQLIEERSQQLRGILPSLPESWLPPTGSALLGRIPHYDPNRGIVAVFGKEKKKMLLKALPSLLLLLSLDQPVHSLWGIDLQHTYHPSFVDPHRSLEWLIHYVRRTYASPSPLFSDLITPIAEGNEENIRRLLLMHEEDFSLALEEMPTAGDAIRRWQEEASCLQALLLQAEGKGYPTTKHGTT